MKPTKKIGKVLCGLLAGMMVLSLTSCGGGLAKYEKVITKMQNASDRTAFENAEKELPNFDGLEKEYFGKEKLLKELKDFEIKTAIAGLSAPEQPDSVFQYELSKDGKGVVINKYKGESPYVVIPSEIQGLPVVEVSGENIFSGVKTISVPGSVKVFDVNGLNERKLYGVEAVSFGEGVERIGRTAFYGSTKLRKVILPSSLKVIEPGAFYGCKSLTSIKLPDSLKVISEGLFYDCENLESVNIPASVKMIDEDAFHNTKITEAIIPEGCEWIGFDSFSWCPELKSITLPSSVKYIMGEICGAKEAGIARGCDSLETINIADGFKPVCIELTGSYVGSWNREVTEKKENQPYSNLFTGNKIKESLALQKMMNENSVERWLYNADDTKVGKDFKALAERPYDKRIIGIVKGSLW